MDVQISLTSICALREALRVMREEPGRMSATDIIKSIERVADILDEIVDLLAKSAKR
jgi:hypothetical protein